MVTVTGTMPMAVYTLDLVGCCIARSGFMVLATVGTFYHLRSGAFSMNVTILLTAKTTFHKDSFIYCNISYTNK